MTDETRAAREALLDTPYGDGWTMGDHANAVERFEAAIRAEAGTLPLGHEHCDPAAHERDYISRKQCYDLTVEAVRAAIRAEGLDARIVRLIAAAHDLNMRQPDLGDGDPLSELDDALAEFTPAELDEYARLAEAER